MSDLVHEALSLTTEGETVKDMQSVSEFSQDIESTTDVHEEAQPAESFTTEHRAESYISDHGGESETEQRVESETDLQALEQVSPDVLNPEEPVKNPSIVLPQAAEDPVAPPRQAEKPQVAVGAVKKSGGVALHTVLCHYAAPVIHDPTKRVVRPVSDRIPVSSYAGPDRQLDLERYNLNLYKKNCQREWTSNAAASDPPRAQKSKLYRVKKKKQVDDWLKAEEKTKERRDHELAVELGYETLVGNLLYIDIPGGRDVNRSWENFLSHDEMDWGFPYFKGSKERPRAKQPEPYLAHQVVEKLWKFPKARLTRTNVEEQDMSLV
ncbi:uncharacterized protein LOC131944652 [Physella acuta]|uniref:uncharacterized protein LOC131944652 n=1 Tax=Physella acuta TaxID=109671 RepID=UPI0027DCA7F8|nr:uncharacterized protein LOC131944652 [Physella acuta]XP_059161400.1 uncharacterized protein LOC131944652 [Physella acuta]XP_059161401.1 uncharacterized protein LOC131944652 [Physella acuta]XP_059161402.1 uncharacterized protein LOC131944652 [Physella acuta]XP_059161404.1 uncharacterized protein LOC131944652 [Physella acuta]